ncbi:hypothetical protein [Gordonia sp. AC31]|uniref:tetratricopeptide repeat protein n=1 Tax=Gordonia sp. AC31 TaxID=2962571 RepID=UPI00288218B0|nr:hypothetical protein [Gordonia sp. AC31]MDT0219968.1 hypothetical protein [Gordonia sp. AC31]
MDWEPTALGVHLSISTGIGEALPPYIDRRHDREILAHLTKIRDEERPGLLTIVGTSCTGKSRAAYEGVKRICPDWHLVFPSSGRELAEILEGGVPARTVVWLDEMQRFLTHTDSGIRSATSILEILLASSGGAIAFVGTLWPSYYHEMTGRPEAGLAREGAFAIRDVLLAPQSRRITNAEGFSERQLDAAIRKQKRELDGVADARIQLAIRTATRTSIDGAIQYSVTQVLAGGAQLVARMSAGDAHAFSPPARAIVRAACDLRQSGLLGPLSRQLLERVSEGYLDAPVRSRVGEGWFRAGLTEATTGSEDDNPYAQWRTHDVHHLGIPALAQEWLASDDRTMTEAYAIHDYLVQDHISRMDSYTLSHCMRSVLTQPDFPSLVRSSDLIEVARRLSMLGEFELALHLARQHDDPAAMADVICRCGQYDEAIARLRTINDPSVAATVRLARLLNSVGRPDEALQALESARDDKDACIFAADLLVEEDRLEDAINILQPHLDSGIDCAVALAQVHKLAGNNEKAARALQPWIGRHRDATLAMQSLLRRVEQVDLSVERPSDGTAANALAAAKDYLENASALTDTGPLIAILQPHLLVVQEAATLLSQIHERDGDYELAAEMLKEPARVWPQAAARRARILGRFGRHSEAISDLEFHAASSQEAAARLADLLVKEGKPDEAIEQLREPAQRFSQTATRRAGLLLASGRESEAIQQLSVHAPISQHAASTLAQLFIARGERTRAIKVLEAPAQREYIGALHLAKVLEDDGDCDGACAVLERFVTRHVQTEIAWVLIKFRMGAPDEAFAMLAQIRPKGRKNGRTLAISGNLLRMLGALRESDPQYSLGALASHIWTDDMQRKANAQVEWTIWNWLDGQSTQYPMDAGFVTSLIEMLSVTKPGFGISRLHYLTRERLCDLAQGLSEQYRSLASITEISPLASDILSEILEPADGDESGR